MMPSNAAYNRPIMRGIGLCLVLIVIAGCLAAAGAQDGSVPLAITTRTNQTAVVGRKVTLYLAVEGGSSPYSWQVAGGTLPPGLSLAANSGLISGTPKQVGEYRFTIVVVDASVPPQQAQREFSLTVTAPNAPLTIDWKELPRIRGDAIKGSVVVANHSEQPFDLTVIVLAVNEIDRATALGYQRFTLAPQASQVIPFEATPGGGRYVVHADAIAEVASSDSIYRARKQTATPLHIH